LAADSDRKHVVLDQSARRGAFPFSDAVLVGSTLYIAGTIGFDPASGKPPASAEQEARLAMDGVEQVLQSQGMAMDDPARAFLGVASLIRGARFEVTGIAVKRTRQ
jgi:enamine deaminase RidA (YjgF/YER057c/UK114 family)